MNSRHVLFSLLSLTAISAVAQEAPTLQRAIVGSWRSSDGQVVEFRTDSTFRMYPKCGPESDAWKKRGFAFLPATWELVDGNHLKLTMTYQGKSKTLQRTVAVVNGELRGTDDNGASDVQQRYTGDLPPTCPLRP